MSINLDFKKGKSTKDAVLHLYANIVKAIETHEKNMCNFSRFC